MNGTERASKLQSSAETREQRLFRVSAIHGFELDDLTQTKQERVGQNEKIVGDTSTKSR